jgi:diguanylate cyclase (GGDEF)-like protein/PAS domain S-box-containing protein
VVGREIRMSDRFEQSISILVVEGDAGAFDLIRTHLSGAGWPPDDAGKTVIRANTLAEGVALARRDKPDVVLLDLSLPDSSGLSTLRAMRAALPDAPLVALTAENDNQQALAALQAGARDCVVKGRFDCDELRRALVRARLEARLRLFQAALNSVAIPIMITDIDARIEWANPAFSQLTGFSMEEALGRNPGSLMKSGRQDQLYYRRMWETILSGKVWRGEIVNRRKNGALYDESLTISPVIDGNGTTRHFVAILQDITERKQMEDQVHQMAFSDTLTGLPNRRLLSDRLSQAMATSKRSGCHGALMFLDLDNFKPLNDLHGHDVGDLLLVVAADRLRNCVREMDTVARFGGDEFVVMLSELDVDRAESAAQAAIVAEKIRIALSEPYLLTIRHEGKADILVEHCCTASIGVALFIDHEASQDDLLKWADMAMYQAKDGGRNSIQFYDPKS